MDLTFALILSYVVDVLSGLSIGGAFLTIITFSLFKDLRTYPIKLIIYLSYSIFLAQSFFLISFYIFETFMCIPSAVLIHFFFIANFCWNFCVAFNFYQMIVRRNREAETYEKWYHIACWGFPSILVCIVGFSDQYGNIGGVCYMTSGVAIFLAFFLPGLIIVSANAVIFFFIAREIHDTMASAPQADKREKRKEFRVYISIFISIGLSWMFGFIMTLFPSGSILQSICLVLFSITTPVQGFLIFFCYCVNARVFGKWAGLLAKCFPFCKQWEQLATSRTSVASQNSHSTAGRSTNSSKV